MQTSAAHAVFYQNNGEVTRRFYADLSVRGPLGLVAMNLFRAQKRSSRAKQYRGRRYKSAAYDVKQYSIAELCRILTEHAENLGIRWGWKSDPGVLFGQEASYVIYCDVPGTGQCSFHSPTRGEGPDYEGDWDCVKGATEDRVIRLCERVLTEAQAPETGTFDFPSQRPAGLVPEEV